MTNYVFMVEVGKNGFGLRRTDDCILLSLWFIMIMFVKQDYLNKLVAGYARDKNRPPEPMNNNSWRNLAINYDERGNYEYEYLVKDPKTEKVYLYGLYSAPDDYDVAEKWAKKDNPDKELTLLSKKLIK